METIALHLIESFKHIINSIDWVYLVMFMITSYLFVKTINSFLYLNKQQKPFFLRTRFVVLFVGFVFALMFGLTKHIWGLPWHNDTNLPYGFILFFSFIFGQFINLYGIEALVDGIMNLFRRIADDFYNKFINL